MDWRRKVELFEEIRREYEFGIGSIAGVAKKLGVHRRMVREAIARRMASDASPRADTVPGSSFDARHVSHLILPIASGGDGDGACLIEPGVRCNHCGYCLSYGH